MKHTIKLTLTLLLTLLMLVPMASASGLAQQVTPTPAAAENTYQEPRERFTVPIPTNWTVQEAEGYAALTGPNEEITVYVLAVENSDIEAAIESAWQMINPAFDLTPEEQTDLPTSGGIEQALSITYETEAEDRVVQGAGRLFEGTVYLILIDAQLSALQQRSSQVNIIQSGYDITALEQVDLSGVEPQPLTEERLAELESYIEEVRQRFNVPGAAVAVVQGDRIVYMQGFGVSDLETGQPITPATRMMIGSTTKTFTTMLMADLVAEGVLDWETPVVDILPSFEVADPDITDQVTVRNLVCNCTGVPRRDVELIFGHQDLTAEGVIESLETFEFFTDFGEAFQYSNQMIATGGYVATVAAGGEYGNLHDAYTELMQQRILKPMGLAYSTFSFEQVTGSGNYAAPYSLNLDFNYRPISLTTERFVEPLAPAGGLWSSAHDMGRYLITQLNRGAAPDGVRIVPAEALTTTWEPQVQVSAEASYGLGWFVDEYKGQLMLHHGGNTLGFTSDLAFLPEADLGISVISNGEATNPFNQAVRYRLLELAFEQEPEYDSQATFIFNQLQERFTEQAANLTELEPERVEPYLGRYANEALGEIELRLEDETLIMDAGEFQAQLRPLLNEEDEVDRYVLYDAPALVGSPVRLDRNEAGRPVVIFGEGVTEYQFETIE